MEIGDLFTRKGLDALTLEHDFMDLIEKAGTKVTEAAGLGKRLQPFRDERLRRMGRHPR